MNTNYSAYDIIESHGSDIQVCLYTPAHQGVSGKSEYFADQIYAYDFPFLTRSKLIGVEKYFSGLYKTKHTFFLTGGATQGILTACSLLATKHRQVALGLNSHISVVHGLVLSGLEPFFIPSKSLMPTAREVIQALETDGKEVRALLLTHPSYEGLTTDMPAISKYCQEREIDLIIDEAHGSHFPFFQEDLNSAIVDGADIVIHSLHKYVGSLVQTALLHIPERSRITEEQVTNALSLFENTTRSNLLILSIEDSIQRAFGDEGRSLFLNATQRCNDLRNLLDSLGTVLNYEVKVRDPLKLLLYSDRATSNEIAELLLERGVDCEYSDETGVLLIFSFQNSEADFLHVAKTLEEINQIISRKEYRISVDEGYFSRQPLMRTRPRTAFFVNRKKLPLVQAKGRISCSCLKKVPPGIPLLIPGEEITDWHLQRLSPDTLVEVIEDYFL
jgi:arginine/lysine/ornithine decarboxylase